MATTSGRAALGAFLAVACLAVSGAAVAEPPTPAKPGAGAKPAAAPKPPERKAVVVATAGGADATTIAEGIRLAGPGGLVRLRAGTYREALEPTASCEVEGEGEAKDVVLEWELAPCVRVAFDGEVVLRGATLRGLGKDGTTPEAAALVESGRLVLERCVLAGTTSEGVLVRGEKARAVLRGCVVKASARGLRVEEGGGVEVEGGEVTGPGLTGIFVTGRGSVATVRSAKVERWQRGLDAGDGAELRLDAVAVSKSVDVQTSVASGATLSAAKCFFRDGAAFGISVAEGGTATFDACEATGHAKSGLHCTGTGSKVVWKGGRIGKNLGSGAYVLLQAEGVFEDVELDGNHFVGVEFREQAKGVVRRARIHDQTTGSGVVVHLQAEARLDAVETWGNGHDAIYVFDAGVLDARGCKLRDSKGTGVTVDSKGKLTLVDTEIWAHDDAVMLYGGADVLLQRVVVREVRGLGVSVAGSAKALLETCEVRGTTGFGLWVVNGELVLRACKLKDGKKWGVGAGDAGKADLAGCEVTGNAEGGVFVDKGGSAVVRDCKVRKNKGPGVRVEAGGGGTFEENDLGGNGGGAWLLDDANAIVRKGNKPNR